MSLVVIRIGLLLTFAALTALIISSSTGAAFSLAVTPQLSALFFIPVNLIGLWLLVRWGRSQGLTLARMMDFDRSRLGRDVLMGLLWMVVLFVPFAAAINLAMLVFYGPADMVSAFETVFAPDPGQFVQLPTWFAWSSAVLVAVLFPLTNAPAEELTYRRHAQTGLQARGWPVWAAISLPAIAFGLQHVFLAPSVAGMAVFGIAFTFWGAGAGLIYLKSGRLMPVVVAHFLTNFMFGFFPFIFLALGFG